MGFCRGLNLCLLRQALRIKCIASIYKRKRWFIPKLWNNYWPIIILGWLLIALITVCMIYLDAIKGVSLLSSSLLISFVIVLWHNLNKKKPRFSTVKNKILLSFIVIISPTLTTPFFPNILNQSMEFIGVRNARAFVQLPLHYKSILSCQANISDFCSMESNLLTCKNATVLFRGIGSNTVVEINHMRIVLPSNDIIIATAVAE